LLDNTPCPSSDNTEYCIDSSGTWYTCAQYTRDSISGISKRRLGVWLNIHSSLLTHFLEQRSSNVEILLDGMHHRYYLITTVPLNEWRRGYVHDRVLEVNSIGFVHGNELLKRFVQALVTLGQLLP
jgi:hypothetical protein